jgi:poly(glycerol-phosphate) alpha-glucosyltransferase
MKAGLLTSSISRKGGGLLHAVCGLALALRERGLPLEVFSLEDEWANEDTALWHPIFPQTFRVAGPGAFGYAPGLVAGLQSADLDLLHVHGLWMYPSSAALAWQRRSGRRHIVSPHGMLDPWAVNRSRWKKRLVGTLFEGAHLREANCLHALCPSEAEAIRAYGLSNPICVIPNGIDLPESREQKVESRNPPWQGQIEPGRKVLLFLSRIHSKKGLVNLIRAWSEIQKAESRKQKAEEWVLAIAGWDEIGHEAELKSLATELAIPWADVRTGGTTGQDNRTTGPRSVVSGQWSVVFLGPQFGEDKAVCYQSCDAFILPSFSEGLPMAVLEAWSYGKPVLMTPECNLPEGFAAEGAIRIETTVEGIGGGLRQLFEMSATQRSRMGANGLDLVARQFTWDKIALDMRRVYDWVLGGGPKPGCVIES